MASKKTEKEARQLPQVQGDDLSFLAEGFRNFVLAQMDDHDDVFCVLVDNMGWDRDDAKRVYGMLESGVGYLFEGTAEEVEDPRARDYQKDKTVVRRNKRG